MSKNKLDALRAELGSAPPPGLSDLDPADLAALAATLRSARMRQQAAVAGALDGVLATVPGLLRGTVRKMLEA